MGRETYIPYREIAKVLDIPEGDVLLLTSDVLKLAMKARKEEKEFISDPFINSFYDELGAEGTLLIPAYNFDLEDGDAFDIRKTVPMTGSLAIAALNDNSFVRTAHPLHSFLVKGNSAQTLAEMKNISSFGPDSPFAWLMEQNAMMVFAGTTVAEAMTFVHFVEETEQVRYRSYKRIGIRYSGRDGKGWDRSYKIYAKKAGWTMQLHRLAKLLPPEVLKENIINGIPFYSIRSRDAFEIISKDIRENNAASIAGFNAKLYFRDIIKMGVQRFNLFRTTYGKIRSAKRIH